MLLVVLCGFPLALIAPPLIRRFGDRGAYAVAAVPALAFLWLAQHIHAVSRGERLFFSYPWSPRHEIALTFQLDGLSLLFALLVAGVGFFIYLYAARYLGDHPQKGRFFAFLSMFMSSMLGLATADNLFVFFVFWELTSITSFLLIAFNFKSAAARRAALQALIVTGGGGLAMIAGLILLAQNIGDYNIHAIVAADIDAIPPLAALAAMGLLLAGAFTKSAQWPFSFWLPNAMAAPTPVSAYLHSATMVKAGVYLCLRFNPLFADLVPWSQTLTTVGGITFLLSVYSAFGETDLKRILARTTVGSLGLLILMTGQGTPHMLEAAIVYLFAHALFKGSMFMAAGGIEHAAGTHNLNRLGGLFGAMPITAVAVLFSALSLCGLPPFIGFVAKELIYADFASPLTLLVLIAGNAMMVAHGAVLFLRPFLRLPSLFSGERAPFPDTHEEPAAMWLGPIVLAALSLASGLFVEELNLQLFAPAVLAVSAPEHFKEPHLHLWGGFNAALGLSLITLGVGAVIVSASDAVRKRVATQRRRFNADKAYDWTLETLDHLAARSVALMQGGKLRHYLCVCFAVTGVAFGGALFLHGLDAPAPPPGGGIRLAGDRFGRNDIALVEALTLIFLLVASGAAIVLRQRLNAILAIGAGGLPLAVFFLLFGAPDLAFTQFMVELISLAALAMILIRLRLDLDDRRSGARRFRDGLVSIAFGAAMGFGLYAAVRGPLDRRLTDYFNAESLPAAHGANVVNVILVDFRALDTLGEITVVLAAGAAILGLLATRRGSSS